MNNAIQVKAKAIENGRILRNIALIVASALAFPSSTILAADPPPGLLRKIAEAEATNAQAMANYTYHQSVTVQEFNDHGAISGEYREVRDVTFFPNHTRYERFTEPPRNTLKRIRLTDDDFADIRDIQPFLLTADKVALYEGKYKGEESVEGVPCFLEQVSPRQILSSQRFFEGFLWARQSDLAVLKTEGQAVPQIETLREQNLTPKFTTIRRIVDGRWSFPAQTSADDTLFFRERPQRIRIEVRYLNYKHFEAESTLTFGDKPSPQSPDKP